MESKLQWGKVSDKFFFIFVLFVLDCKTACRLALLQNNFTSMVCDIAHCVLSFCETVAKITPVCVGNRLEHMFL